MASRNRRKQRWCPQPLTPLMEGPDFGMEDDEGNKKESSWEIIREWFRTQRNVPGGNSFSSSISLYGPNIPPAKRQDLRLLLGVLGCPLAPIPISDTPISNLHIRDIPLETSTAYYIIQQYLAAAGCSKQRRCAKNMYASGMVKLIRCETEISTGKSVRTMGSRTGENGCFVLWRMSPEMWSLELAVAGNKVVAGSDGKIVWRHTPWLGTHAAKGPQRPLRRIIQGLDPKSTAGLFSKAQCLGEKRIGDDDCFVLKVAADRAAVMERNEGPAEVIRHVLYGYFSQRSGLLIYMEDSHLTRVHSAENDTVYWETTIGSSIGDYRDVDGVLIAHQGRTVATVFRFGETSMEHTRTRMEEIWRINDVVFNVPGLSGDSFIPPADIFDTAPTVSP
ncbi:C-type mannose receptor [Perilla frutescens var. hirtella]|uniref:C-type mannose receptor n=1 Tax=Perilla frutescens var. hirtella TaxID=608512 RepID=A0AAD4PCA8_PERFH|nr:C-type mannose receptor [Perilla frutescens var. hirtella]